MGRVSQNSRNAQIVEKNLSQKAISGVKWSAINNFGIILSKFTLGIIIARLLTPEDYGIIALVTVITSIAPVFIDSGFGSKIIQAKTINEKELSSVFWLNIAIGFFFTLLILFGAPVFNLIYENEDLITIARIISLVYLIQSFGIVQKAVLRRQINFKRIAIVETSAIILSSIVGIVFAWFGYGYWSLLIKQMVQITLTTTLFWFLSSWKPNFYFDFKIIKNYWKYSINILSTTLITTIVQKIDYFLVGKFFQADILGLYSRGKELAFFPVQFSSRVLNMTSFSVFSKLQDETEKFEKLYMKTFKLILYTFVPIMMLIFLTSDEIILILLGKKWEGASIYLKYFSIAGIIYLANSLRVNLINSKGRPDLNLKFGAVAGPGRLLVLLLVTFFIKELHPIFYIWIYIVFLAIAFFYMNYYMSKLTSFSINDQLKGVLPEISLNLFNVLCVYFISHYYLNNVNIYFDVILKTFIYFTIYLSASFIFKMDSYLFIRNMIIKK